MEITKTNEQYAIADSTDDFVVNGSLNVNPDKTYSYSLSFDGSGSYYKNVSESSVNVSYNIGSDKEDAMLTYLTDNSAAILEKVTV